MRLIEFDSTSTHTDLCLAMVQIPEENNRAAICLQEQGHNAVCKYTRI